MIISKTFRFEASHVLPKHKGKCSSLHGHSWVLKVAISGPVNEETGFIVDYAILKEIVEREIINKVDHQHLGQGGVGLRCAGTGADWNYVGSNFQAAVFGQDFYPSSENLVKLFWNTLSLPIENLGPDIFLNEVSLDETCTSRATILA